ncbi:MAG: hypothetical protein P8046_04775, partial [Anaerolineales bacterium]
MKRIDTKHTRHVSLGLMVLGVMIIVLVAAPLDTLAQSPLHPTFAFLDENGDNVLESGNPVSTLTTCGQCHDTEFISSHSFHADAGFSAQTEPGETSSGRAWDTSEGLYGRWNPITYGYLSPEGDEITDLTTTEWLQTIGQRHVGGGPAQESGIDMNCFLCHLNVPANDARIQALEEGQFEWANTATLVESGVVSYDGSEYLWNDEAFDQDGYLLPAFISIQDPKNENCGQCHGTVHDPADPVVGAFCVVAGFTAAHSVNLIWVNSDLSALAA